MSTACLGMYEDDIYPIILLKSSSFNIFIYTMSEHFGFLEMPNILTWALNDRYTYSVNTA